MMIKSNSAVALYRIDRKRIGQVKYKSYIGRQFGNRALVVVDQKSTHLRPRQVASPPSTPDSPISPRCVDTALQLIWLGRTLPDHLQILLEVFRISIDVAAISEMKLKCYYMKQKTINFIIKELIESPVERLILRFLVFLGVELDRSVAKDEWLRMHCGIAHWAIKLDWTLQRIIIVGAEVQVQRLELLLDAAANSEIRICNYHMKQESLI